MLATAIRGSEMEHLLAKKQAEVPHGELLEDHWPMPIFVLPQRGYIPKPSSVR
jgi:hypothetical protein